MATRLTSRPRGRRQCRSFHDPPEEVQEVKEIIVLARPCLVPLALQQQVERRNSAPGKAALMTFMGFYTPLCHSQPSPSSFALALILLFCLGSLLPWEGLVDPWGSLLGEICSLGESRKRSRKFTGNGGLLLWNLPWVAVSLAQQVSILRLVVLYWRLDYRRFASPHLLLDLPRPGLQLDLGILFFLASSSSNPFLSSEGPDPLPCSIHTRLRIRTNLARSSSSRHQQLLLHVFQCFRPLLERLVLFHLYHFRPLPRRSCEDPTFDLFMPEGSSLHLSSRRCRGSFVLLCPGFFPCVCL
mmetsp:Transcript_42345/g.133418  ORF Transcript_42345/g.133418 Transcript_42345/m.133418 type:complete len:299 (-) Transcript_42345:1099-1995(-)